MAVTVKDNANTSTGTASTNVTVYPVAPLVTWTADPATANEGNQKTYSFSVTDPDTLDTFSYGSLSPTATGGTVSGLTITTTAPTTTANANGSFVVTFNKGIFNGGTSSTSTVGLTVQDNANTLTGTATQAVAVTAVAPTVLLSTPTRPPPTRAKRRSSRSTSPIRTFWTRSATPPTSRGLRAER